MCLNWPNGKIENIEEVQERNDFSDCLLEDEADLVVTVSGNAVELESCSRTAKS